MSDIDRWLETLENALDPAWEREKLATWKRFLDFQPFTDGFRINKPQSDAKPGEWPKVLVNEAIRDKGKMLLQQLRPVYESTCRKTLAIPAIRCNYGTAVLSSVFEPELCWMDESLDTLPTSRPFEDKSRIDEIIQSGVPDINKGFGKDVFETAEYYKDKLAPYPKLSEFVWIYHPDTQGPVDVMELLWGSEMYIAFYMEPEKVKSMLDVITKTYVVFMEHWDKIIPHKDPVYSVHWARLIKGQIMLRNDSIVNLSPDMYNEFVKPYDEKLMARFGKGAIHSCGHIDHCIDFMTDSKNLTFFNMSQPELNDMKKIHAAAQRNKIILDTPFKDGMAGLDISRGVLIN